jgi:fatty acid desaturase
MSAQHTAPAEITVGTPFSRFVAVVGIVVGFIAILGIGVLSLLNYRGWKAGRDRYPVLAWLVGWFALSGIGCFVAVLALAGWSRIGDYGSAGSLAMVIGSLVGTVLTWFYDQRHAPFPTLKLKSGSAPPRPDSN